MEQHHAVLLGHERGLGLDEHGVPAEAKPAGYRHPGRYVLACVLGEQGVDHLRSVRGLKYVVYLQDVHALVAPAISIHKLHRLLFNVWEKVVENQSFKRRARLAVALVALEVLEDGHSDEALEEGGAGHAATHHHPLRLRQARRQRLLHRMFGRRLLLWVLARNTRVESQRVHTAPHRAARGLGGGAAALPAQAARAGLLGATNARAARSLPSAAGRAWFVCFGRRRVDAGAAGDC
mmetsp:Transcript_38337/g.73455  ORF Transcript_38337/g.73455 Transcript_38337/m.73455 type:complete len:236 (-) Transcript_38337:1421-2128(-)